MTEYLKPIRKVISFKPSIKVVTTTSSNLTTMFISSAINMVNSQKFYVFFSATGTLKSIFTIMFKKIMSKFNPPFFFLYATMFIYNFSIAFTIFLLGKFNLFRIILTIKTSNLKKSFSVFLSPFSKIFITAFHTIIISRIMIKNDNDAGAPAANALIVNLGYA